MARLSITGWPEPIRDKKGTIKMSDSRPGVQAIVVEPRVEVFDNVDKSKTFKLETWINIVSSKGDEYTINDEWTDKQTNETTQRRTARLQSNGEGDELYYREGSETSKFHFRPGVCDAISVACREGILIMNERNKNKKKKSS